MATGKTKIRDVILEAIATRGVLAEGEEKVNLNSKTINSAIKKLIENSPKVLKSEGADPWKSGAINAFSSYLNNWENLKLPDKTSVLDMPIEEFKKPSNLEYVAKKIKEQKFSYGTGLETVFDQITKYSGYDTNERYFTEFFGTRTGRKVKRQTGTGTGRGRKVVDLPNDIYATLREIEKGINNPLSRITAQYMNLTGHRAQETKGLKIENFLKSEGTVGEGSTYGTKYNLHASGWELKQGYKAVNFTVLGKTLIYNALKIAEQEGRTSGLLFPSADAVDNIVTDGLKAKYGAGSIETYVTGKEVAESGDPSRALLRKLAKGRYLASEGIQEFSGQFYKGIINILQGIADTKTENAYSSVNDREGAINHIGEFVDNRFIAFSGSNNLVDFLNNNDLEVPEGLAEYVEEQKFPKSKFLITGRTFLSWMPKEARLKLLANEPVASVPVSKIDDVDIAEQREDTKVEKKVDRQKSLRKKIIDDVKEKQDDINKLTDIFKEQGDSEEKARQKAIDTLDGKVTKKTSLKQENINSIIDNSDPDVDSKIDKIVKDNNLDLSKPEDIAKLFTNKMERTMLDDFVNETTTFVSDAGEQIMDLMPDRQSNLGKIGSAAAGAIIQGVGGRFIKPVKYAGKVAKGVGKVLFPQTTLEGRGEIASMMPDLDPEVRKFNEEEQRKRKIKEDTEAMADAELQVEQDNLKSPRNRALGDGDPMTKVNKELGELGF